MTPRGFSLPSLLTIVDRRFEAGDVHVVGVGHRRRRRRARRWPRHDFGGRGEGEARHEHRVARPDAGGQSGSTSASVPLAQPISVLDADIGRDLVSNSATSGPRIYLPPSTTRSMAALRRSPSRSRCAPRSMNCITPPVKVVEFHWFMAMPDSRVGLWRGSLRGPARCRGDRRAMLPKRAARRRKNARRRKDFAAILRASRPTLTHCETLIDCRRVGVGAAFSGDLAAPGRVGAGARNGDGGCLGAERQRGVDLGLRQAGDPWLW